jgi:hypothetical protein
VNEASFLQLAVAMLKTKASDYEAVTGRLPLCEFSRTEKSAESQQAFLIYAGTVREPPRQTSDNALVSQFNNRRAVVTQPGEHGLSALAFFRCRRS